MSKFKEYSVKNFKNNKIFQELHIELLEFLNSKGFDNKSFLSLNTCDNRVPVFEREKFTFNFSQSRFDKLRLYFELGNIDVIRNTYYKNYQQYDSYLIELVIHLLKKFDFPIIGFYDNIQQIDNLEKYSFYNIHISDYHNKDQFLRFQYSKSTEEFIYNWTTEKY